jgi:hypothetical protein
VTYTVKAIPSSTVNGLRVADEFIDEITDSTAGTIWKSGDPAHQQLCTPVNSGANGFSLICTYSVPFNGLAGASRTSTITVYSHGDLSTGGAGSGMGPFRLTRQTSVTVALTPAPFMASQRNCKGKSGISTRCFKKRRKHHRVRYPARSS